MIRGLAIIFALCFILLLLLHILMLLDHRQRETSSKYRCQLEGIYYTELLGKLYNKILKFTEIYIQIIILHNYTFSPYGVFLILKLFL